MAWKIKFQKRAKKEFSKLDQGIKSDIKNAICDKLLADPDRYLKKLKGDKKNLYKFRVGDYRLICDKRDQELIVAVLKVGHRRRVYN